MLKNASTTHKNPFSAGVDRSAPHPAGGAIGAPQTPCRNWGEHIGPRGQGAPECVGEPSNTIRSINLHFALSSYRRASVVVHAAIWLPYNVSTAFLGGLPVHLVGPLSMDTED